jgi:Ca-activated chloride channel family protein
MPLTQSTLVSPEPKTLPLTGASLRVDAGLGLAEVVLEQRFSNPHAEPLHVTYSLPLPHDAAVSHFRFRVGDRAIEGEIDTRHKARERYEEAIATGHTAALLEQDRASLFTQEIGNVPPGAEVVCEVGIDQRLVWSESGFEWRFPLAAAPRYLGSEGRVADAHKVAFDVAETLPVRASLAMSIRDALGSRSPESPSHPLQCRKGLHAYEVELGSGNAVPLDRDVVVRWQVADGKVGVTAETTAPFGSLTDAHALLTLVPPAKNAEPYALSRDLILLLDTSGSMGGDPLRQAQRIASALVDGLSDRDQLEMVEFSSSARRYKSGAVQATKDEKRDALKWIGALRSSGGTEMRDGIREAMRTVRRESQRQIVLVTDGLIGFETEVVAEILSSLPEGSRLHTVGVGSSVNRSLTAPAARAGRGVEVVVGLGEDPERAAQKLKARTETPLVVGVTAEGSALLSTAPARLPDLFAGSPVLVSAKVRAEGGTIVLRGRTADGPWEERVEVSLTERGRQSVARLYGREAVEDAEMRLGAGTPREAIDREVEALGLAYRIATRLTSWVAVDSEPSVDPTKPTRRERMPQALPHGLSIEGLGLRAASMPIMRTLAYAGAPPPMPAGPRMAAPQSTMSAPKGSGGFFGRVRSLFQTGAAGGAPDDEAPAGAFAPPAPYETASRAAPEQPAYAEKRKDAVSLESKASDALAPVVLTGTIVLFKDGRLVVEIVAPYAIDWDPTAVELVSGPRFPAAIEAAFSTGRGAIPAGATVRLVLSIARDVPRPTALVVTMPSGTLEVVLR